MCGQVDLTWGQSQGGRVWGRISSVWLLYQPGWKRSRRLRGSRQSNGPRDWGVSGLIICATKLRSSGITGAVLIRDNWVIGKLSIRARDEVGALKSRVCEAGGCHAGLRAFRYSGCESRRRSDQAELSSSLTPTWDIRGRCLIFIHIS